MRAYEPIFELGRGGMGVVYLACGRGAGGFENLVVLKRLHAQHTRDGKAIQRFLNEAKVAGLIHHANVVGTQYVGEDEAGYFLVLEYVEGLSLDDLDKRAQLQGRLVPVPILLRVALDTLAGLSAVHDAVDATGRRLNLLHRDISPHNLLIGRDGVTRLADFGVARSEFHATTERQYLVGKLAYLPREYVRREELLPRADIYGLGVSLWSTLIGHEPWPDAEEVHVLRHILEHRLPPVSTAREVSAGVEAMVMRATEPEPEGRYQSAGEMAEAIESLVGRGEPIASTRDVAEFVQQLAGEELLQRSQQVAAWFTSRREPAPEEQPAPRRPRVSLRAGAALLLLLSVAAAGAAAWMDRRQNVRVMPLPSGVPDVPIARAPGPEATVQPLVAPAEAGSELGGAAAPLASGPKTPTIGARSPAGTKSATVRGTPPKLPAQIVTKNPYR